jgi:hypothetical protein
MNETELEPEVVSPSTEAVPPIPDDKAEEQPGLPTYVPVPPPSRFKRSVRSATRWFMVVLIAFLAGIALMAYPLLQAQTSLKSAVKERDQVKFALTLQNKLLASLQHDQSRLIVLRALSELRAAKLALSNNDDVNLPLFLDKAAQVMKTAPDSLMETQQATVVKIQQKLALAQEKSKSNLTVTKSELNQLLDEAIENLRNLDAVLNPNP